MIEYDEHAIHEMQERGIEKSWVEETLESPEDIVVDEQKRRASYIKCLTGRHYALRVVVPSYRRTYVITAYFDRRNPCD